MPHGWVTSNFLFVPVGTDGTLNGTEMLLICNNTCRLHGKSRRLSYVSVLSNTCAATESERLGAQVAPAVNSIFLVSRKRSKQNIIKNVSLNSKNIHVHLNSRSCFVFFCFFFLFPLASTCSWWKYFGVVFLLGPNTWLSSPASHMSLCHQSHVGKTRPGKQSSDLKYAKRFHRVERGDDSLWICALLI